MVAGNGELYLGKLAELGTGLAHTTPGSSDFFAAPLKIVQEAMGFTLSVVYRVRHATARTLTLEVADVLDPTRRRAELARGAQLTIDLEQPDRMFRNEAHAFRGRDVAAENIPGVGCDIAGFVSAGEDATDGYLLAGDFVGAEASLQHVDVRAFEVATGLLSALLMKAHFQQRADRDPLTGLMSSARIRTELDRGLRRPMTDRGIAIALMDVDDFKRINDTHGHVPGDAVLETIGGLIAATLRPRHDHAGRYGGDEFLIIMEGTSMDEATAALENLRLAVANHVFGDIGPSGGARRDAPLRVTVSIGGCLLPTSSLSAAEVLTAADRALYEAKSAGRNTVRVSGHVRPAP